MNETVALEQEQNINRSLDSVDAADSEHNADIPKKHSVVSKRLAIKIFTVFVACVQSLLIILLLCGAVQYYRHGISIVYAVNLFIKLFAISRAIVYRTLFGVVSVVLYTVVLVFLIKWFVITINRCIHIVLKKDGDDCAIFGAASVIYGNCLDSFRWLIVLIVVNGLLAPCDITGMAIAIMVLVGVVFVANEIFSILLNAKMQAKWVMIALRVVKYILVFAALCLAIAILNSSAVKDLIYGFQKMFNGNVFSDEVEAKVNVYIFYTDLIEPALFIAITIVFLLILDEILQPTNAYYYLTKSKIRISIVLTSILIATHFIFRVLVINGSSFASYMIGEWLQTVSKAYLPLLLTLITWYISYTALRNT